MKDVSEDNGEIPQAELNVPDTSQDQAPIPVAGRDHLFYFETVTFQVRLISPAPFS